MDNWKLAPTSVDNCDMTKPDFIIAMDETGTPTLSGMVHPPRPDLKWFTLTGIAIDKTNINLLASKITALKEAYWENGSWQGKRVVFHSREIRKREGAFNTVSINYDSFRRDLNDLIQDLPITVSAATIDKSKHVTKYLYPEPVYPLAISFIFERLTYRMNFLHSTCSVLLESRGPREDANLLRMIVSLVDHGSRYVSPENLRCINGVYFNRKRTADLSKSYWPLELADLVSYRIHHYQTVGQQRTADFSAIEEKLIGYPSYLGKGLKIFP